MALKRKATSQPQYYKDVDFRCPSDDAWHIVKLAKVEGVLRVIYVNFLDELYYSDQFESLAEIEELLGRFRLPAKHLQDSQCAQVYEGMVVLASHEFSAGELLFHDASVDSVSQSEHRADDGTEEKECTCKFSLKWKHGPRMGKNDTVGIEHICLIEELPVEDPVLKDFIDSARKSLEERMGNLVNQGGSSGVNPTNLPELIGVDHSNGSPHHQVDDVIAQTGDGIGTLGEEKDALEDRCSQAEAEVARLKAKIADMEEQARAASAWEKENSELERKVSIFQKETERYEGLLQEEQARAEAEVARLKAEQEHAASSWEKEKSELERKVSIFQKETERYEGLLQEEQARAEAEVVRLKAEQAHAESSWEKEKSELERKVSIFRKETERYEGLLQEEQARAEAEVARLKAEQAHAASSWEKEKSELERNVSIFRKEMERYEGLLQEEQARAEAEVARLKAEQAHAASSWEKEKSELERKVSIFQKETERYKGLLQEEQVRSESEVARLKAEQAHGASSWEKEKSELERKVEQFEKVLAGELYFQKEIKRYEGFLQERDAQLQIFRAQMQIAKAEREQAILALYEVEAKLKGKRYKVDKSAAEWKIPEHLTLPPSETVVSTIRNSQAFTPFRRQIEKEIRERLMKQHNARSPLK